MMKHSHNQSNILTNSNQPLNWRLQWMISKTASHPPCHRKMQNNSKLPWKQMSASPWQPNHLPFLLHLPNTMLWTPMQAGPQQTMRGRSLCHGFGNSKKKCLQKRRHQCKCSRRQGSGMCAIEMPNQMQCKMNTIWARS